MSEFPVLDLTPDELLTTTRTVRKRLDLTRPVPLDLIKECLEIALQAPSGSNRQGWQWMVVTDPELRRQIGDIYRDVTESYLASQGSAAQLFSDDPDRAAVQARVGSSAEWLGQHMGEVPVLMIPCIKAERTLPAGNQAGLWGSLLPAVWSYALAARARGLGTAWTTLHLSREAEVAELLGIPEGFHQGALIPTAYFTGETFKPAAREPIDNILHIDRW
ncbi:nitroreductase family protein [Rhodococcus sp. KBS0724]|jgi:nitroreductase|uniref:nitroreductase family protein n=1 Tax=Rhodococcus sp. KBS0724 TaxID=1179674 RepID=UPI00110D9DAB|nr:nitroreductase family protein [Rhodococcus sp. KBS0724]TSD47776.1 nitroreductase family protein [Rhodococcus sp. KBS0724]